MKPVMGKRCIELPSDLLVCSIVQRNHSTTTRNSDKNYACLGIGWEQSLWMKDMSSLAKAEIQTTKCFPILSHPCFSAEPGTHARCQQPFSIVLYICTSCVSYRGSIKSSKYKNYSKQTLNYCSWQMIGELSHLICLLWPLRGISHTCMSHWTW